MKKKCSLCQKEFPATREFFNKKSSRPDGLQGVCRTCNGERSRKYYEDNKEKHLKVVKVKNRAYVSRNVDFFTKWKSEQKCQICGESRYACLDLHHLDPSKKEGNLSYCIHNGWSIERIQREIDKCMVLCSNCHRVLHHEEKQSAPPEQDGTACDF